MEKELQRVDPNTLKPYDKVLVFLPKGHPVYKNKEVHNCILYVQSLHHSYGCAFLVNRIDKAGDIGITIDFLHLYHPPQPAPQSQPINPQLLKEGLEVLINTPKEEYIHGKTGVIKSFNLGLGKTRVAVKGEGIECTLYLSELSELPGIQSQEDVPMLIELEKVFDYMHHFLGEKITNNFKEYFLDREPQYHPKEERLKAINASIKENMEGIMIIVSSKDEQPSPEAMIQALQSEWVPEVGDIVITKGQPTWTNPKFVNYFGKQGVIKKTENVDHHYYEAGYFVHETFWPLSSLTLVKKADKPTGIITIKSHYLPGVEYNLSKNAILIKEDNVRFESGLWDN